MISIPRVPANCTLTELKGGKWIAHVTTPVSDFSRYFTITAATDKDAAMKALARFEEEYPHDRSGHTVGS